MSFLEQSAALRTPNGCATSPSSSSNPIPTQSSASFPTDPSRQSTIFQPPKPPDATPATHAVHGASSSRAPPWVAVPHAATHFPTRRPSSADDSSNHVSYATAVRQRTNPPPSTTNDTPADGHSSGNGKKWVFFYITTFQWL